MIGDKKRGPATRLTQEQEAELVRLYTETETTPKVLYRRFGISKQSLYNILNRHGVPSRRPRPEEAA
jgi:hypothetical protein